MMKSLMMSIIALGMIAGEKMVHAQVPSTPLKEDQVRVLIFSGTGWYRHYEMADINGWLVRLGAEHDIDMHVTETAADITPERLERYDVVLFQNSNWLGEVFNEAQQQALIDWYENGGAFVGIHGAAVHADTWDWFTDLIGCNFTSDSDWQHARLLVPEAVADLPIVAGFGQEFMYHADYQNYDRDVSEQPGTTVLVYADDESFEPVRDSWRRQGAEPMEGDHPIVWIREYKGGRLFYTGIGHDLRSLDTPFGRQHIIEGIRWVMGGDEKMPSAEELEKEGE